jgi:hypothetical protein
MRGLSWALRAGAVIVVIAGCLHVALGLGADALLGAKVPADAMADPALDSQNRFYGAAFWLYAVLLFIGARDPRRHRTVLRAVLWVFFAAGAVRLISIAKYGVPPAPVVGLLVAELVLPPLLLMWLRKSLAGTETTTRTAPRGIAG